MPADVRGRAINHGYTQLIMWLTNHNEMRPGIDALLAAQVIGAWTAFEVLVADLWETALNLKPALGFRALEIEICPEDDEETKENKARKKEELPIPLWMVEKEGFDIDKNMGTLVKSKRKWDFTNRSEAKDAYLKVFKNHKQVIKKIFEADQLQWLTAMRNALIHRAGKADSEFCKWVKRHPILKNVPEGAVIPLNGEMIESFTSAARDAGQALIEFVNERLLE